MTGRLRTALTKGVYRIVVVSLSSFLSRIRFTISRNGTYPDYWFRDVKKFSVREDIYYLGGRVVVIVKIYYKSWWRLSRRIAFVQNESETRGVPDPHREARILVERLKSITNCLDAMGPELKRPKSSYRQIASRPDGI